MIDEEVFDRIYPYREKKEKSEEDRKTYGDVFDRRTLLAFYKLLKRTIDYVEFPISTGKEATVFRAVNKDGELIAVKVYLITRLNYKGLSRFIDGDDRFAHVHKTKDNIIFIWAKKEFRNLQAYHDAGVRVPAPVDMWKNIIVMEYVGDESQPAPLLKDCMEKVKKEIIYAIVEEMRKMHKAKLVHGDLSEYNILVWNDEPWVIDVGQAVPTTHPMAAALLSRDVRNIAALARKMGVAMDEKCIMAELGVD
ncbi:MAG: Kae1-associated serine/threonine protein kinase [Euryarchaeota archaeon]|nr:Kae1-associated serine/threonine protein kinase [Euryarchaeota archaeon]